MGIEISEIKRMAEHYSAQHYHYYIGIEHLFIALTKLDNGLSNGVLEACGIEPRYLRYSIREAIGVSEDERYWTGYKDTPRTQRVVDRAQRYAGQGEPQERDLFLAILDEGDSVPVRVLQEMGADLTLLRTTAADWSPHTRTEVPKVPIDNQVELSPDEREVLWRMFRGYDRVIIERELGGSYTGARLLVVQPHRSGWAQARVVVKIDEQPIIQFEKRHYDSYVKDTLPPTTARLLDSPALPDSSVLGGLKYTLVHPTDSTDPTDLRDYVTQISGIELSDIIRDRIYKRYVNAWWGQRQRYRFGVWREYEHVLPAAIEIYAIEDAPPGTASQVLKPLGTWSRRYALVKGELVELRGFTVRKVRPHKGTLQLTAGSGSEAVHRSSKVEVHGLGEKLKEYRPGDTIEVLVGRVSRTRDLILREQAETLDPPFDLRLPTIPAPQPMGELPNPLHTANQLLDQKLSGYLSIIHGDLHLGNVLVGPGDDVWLIDFGLTREGHSLFDWAVLEVSLLSSAVGPRMPTGWDGVWGTIRLMNAINKLDIRSYNLDNPVAEAFESIRTLRAIVAESLARQGEWSEYFIALALVALRGLSWSDTATTDVRRLLLLTAALSVGAALEIERDQPNDLTTDTISDNDLRKLMGHEMSSDDNVLE